MGYILQAFIGRQEDLQILADNYSNAQVVTVGQHISIVPMTEELFDEINALCISEDISTFMFLTTTVEQAILKLIGAVQVGYIEAEYFGGQGGQHAILWKDGQRFKMFEFGQHAINSVLKQFGMVVLNRTVFLCNFPHHDKSQQTNHSPSQVR